MNEVVFQARRKADGTWVYDVTCQVGSSDDPRMAFSTPLPYAVDPSKTLAAIQAECVAALRAQQSIA